MNPEAPLPSPGDNAGRILLPNLGAEEGRDWDAVANQPLALVAARLWALLFAGQDQIRFGAADAEAAKMRCESLWPEALGTVPESPAFEWLEQSGAHAWLNSDGAKSYAEKSLGVKLAGLPPHQTAEFSDKAKCIQTADRLGLTPRPLAPLLNTISAEECAAPETLIPQLKTHIADWPPWTEQRFTLKPRFGTSGRGRVGGVGTEMVDTPGLRGALRRFETRGGAILEPWLTRETDLSVSVLVPDAKAQAHLPTLLGSLEMLTSPSGGYRGHCGEVDNRGRVFSAHSQDEILRGEAAQLAGEMQSAGFAGPCGIDAFTYWEADRLRLRSAVEFNPRVTMGIVTLGLIRRALPFVRDRLDLSPGSRRGVLMTTFSQEEGNLRDALRARAGEHTIVFDLASPAQPSATLSPKADTFRPTLFFSPDLESLRTAYREATGC